MFQEKYGDAEEFMVTHALRNTAPCPVRQASMKQSCDLPTLDKDRERNSHRRRQLFQYAASSLQAPGHPPPSHIHAPFIQVSQIQ